MCVLAHAAAMLQMQQDACQAEMLQGFKAADAYCACGIAHPCTWSWQRTTVQAHVLPVLTDSRVCMCIVQVRSDTGREPQVCREICRELMLSALVHQFHASSAVCASYTHSRQFLFGAVAEWSCAQVR